MECSGDPELADEEHEGAQRGGLPIDPGPDDGEAGQVNHDKEEAGKRDTETSVHKD